MQPPSAWRLLAFALGYCLLAAAGVVVFGILAGVFSGPGTLLAAGASSRTMTPNVRALAQLAANLGIIAVLAWAAFERGRVVGQGDLRDGLGDGSVENRSTIAILAIVLVAYGAVVAVADSVAHPDILSARLSVSRWLLLLSWIFILLVAPVMEELFFRGWLWTGLREHWTPLPTAVVTSALWLALRYLESGSTRALLLIPVAVVLATARNIGDSVRASIVVHLSYNLSAEFAPLALRAAELI
jgi:membrane protease YdiL (CAAX protease family)